MYNFIEKCVQNNASAMEIDNYIAEWHDSNSNLTIYEYLGMTESEYAQFVKDENNLNAIIGAHQQYRVYRAYVIPYGASLHTAHSSVLL